MQVSKQPRCRGINACRRPSQQWRCSGCYCRSKRRRPQRRRLAAFRARCAGFRRCRAAAIGRGRRSRQSCKWRWRRCSAEPTPTAQVAAAGAAAGDFKRLVPVAADLLGAGAVWVWDWHVTFSLHSTVRNWPNGQKLIANLPPCIPSAAGIQAQRSHGAADAKRRR